MTDTTMRREFDAIYKGGNKGDLAFADFKAGWQAATERATQVERERAAKVCLSQAVVAIGMAKAHGLTADTRDYRICAAAIRQGGDT